MRDSPPSSSLPLSWEITNLECVVTGCWQEVVASRVEAHWVYSPWVSCRKGGKKKEECYLHEKINEGKGKGGREGGREGRDEGKGGRSPTLVILQQLVHSDVPHLLWNRPNHIWPPLRRHPEHQQHSCRSFWTQLNIRVIHDTHCHTPSQHCQ